MENDTARKQLALITGGSSGIGKEIAKLLAMTGYSVAILARNKERLQSAKDEIDSVKAGDQTVIIAIQADVSDESNIKTEIARLINEHSVPDYLFNCAGSSEPGYIQEFTISQFEQAMKIDYMGTVIPTMAVLPHMIGKGSGHIVNISSAAGFIGIIGYGTYTPAKFAVVGFSEVLRHEMRPFGIKVSIVYPSDVDTPGFHKENETKPEECKIISEHSKILPPDVIAREILKGVQKDKAQIFPGESSFLYNMKRLFPGLVRRIIDSDLDKARKRLGKS